MRGGTKEGGKKAAETIKLKYGQDWFENIGAEGGRKSRGGGFAWMAKHDPKRLKEISRKAGLTLIAKKIDKP